MISFLFPRARLPFDRTAPSQYHTLLLIFYSNAAVKDSYEPWVVDALRLLLGWGYYPFLVKS